MRKPFLYRILIPIATTWFKLKYKPIYINKEAIPKKGRVLLAGNHKSKSDPLLVASSTKRCVRGVGKAELFKLIINSEAIIWKTLSLREKQSALFPKFLFHSQMHSCLFQFY